jgi:hypothetical protein
MLSAYIDNCNFGSHDRGLLESDQVLRVCLIGYNWEETEGNGKKGSYIYCVWWGMRGSLLYRSGTWGNFHVFCLDHA